MLVALGAAAGLREVSIPQLGRETLNLSRGYGPTQPVWPTIPNAKNWRAYFTNADMGFFSRPPYPMCTVNKRLCALEMVSKLVAITSHLPSNTPYKWLFRKWEPKGHRWRSCAEQAPESATRQARTKFVRPYLPVEKQKATYKDVCHRKITAVTSNPNLATNGAHHYFGVHTATTGIYERVVAGEINEVALVLAGQPSRRAAKPNQPEPQPQHTPVRQPEPPSTQTMPNEDDCQTRMTERSIQHYYSSIL